MKRIGNIFGRIVSLENLRLADEKASKGKSSQPGVIHTNNLVQMSIFKIIYILIWAFFHRSEFKELDNDIY